jgi:uncharacterized integral membrane protein
MSFRLFILTVLVVIALINMAINYQTVEYYFLWAKGSLPLSIISLFSMAYGLIIGVFYLGYIKAHRRLLKKNSKKEQGN